MLHLAGIAGISSYADHCAYQLITLSLKLQKGLLELLPGVLMVDIALEICSCILLELVL